MTCFQAVISNSASRDDVALTPDGLDGNKKIGRKNKLNKKKIRAKKQKNKSCQMHNRDQLT